MCPVSTELRTTSTATTSTGLRTSLTSRAHAAYNGWTVRCAMERGVPHQRRSYEMSQNLGRRQALVAVERLNTIATFADVKLRGKRLNYHDAILLISEFDAWYSRHTATCPRSMLCVCPAESIQSGAPWSPPVFSAATSEPSLESTRPAQSAVRYRVVATPATPTTSMRNETCTFPCAKRLRLHRCAEDTPSESISADLGLAPRLVRCPPGAPPPAPLPRSSVSTSPLPVPPTSRTECTSPTFTRRRSGVEIWTFGPEDNPQG